MIETCPLCHSSCASKLVRRKDGRWIKRCEQCEHCFIPISEDADWLRELYDSSYNFSSVEEAESHRVSGEWFRDPKGYFQIGLNWLKQTQSLKGKRVLEVGCGLGHVLASLREEGAQIRGIDRNPSAAVLAKKWFDLDTHVGEIEALVPRLPKNYFDIVIFFETIEHLIDPSKVLQQLHALLIDKGLLLVSTPNFSLFWSERSGYSDLSQRFEHIHFFQLHTLSAALKKTGFNVVEHIPCGSIHPLIERLALRTGLRPLIASCWSSLRKLVLLRAPLRLVYRRFNSLTASMGADKGLSPGLFVVGEKAAEDRSGVEEFGDRRD